jgi:transposase
MARAYSDDLRRKILQAYGRSEGTEQELAERFGVSYGYVKKIRRQQLRTGQMERVRHHPGRKPELDAPMQERLRRWLREQPDLTLAELQEKLRQEARLRVSQPSIWVVLRKKMGLRLKKSRSTRRNRSTRRSSSSGRRSSSGSAR